MAISEDRNGEGIVLRDDSGLCVRFATDGRLVEIGNGECTWTLKGPCYGWSLRMQWADDDPAVLMPCGAAEITRPDECGVEMVFDAMRFEDGREVEVSVRLAWRLEEGRLKGQLLNVELPEGLKPAALAFPDIQIPYGTSTQWVIPFDIGLVMDNPCAEHVRAKGMPGVERQNLHMQFTAWLADGAGLYLDSRDTDGWMKSLLLQVGEGDARLCIEHILPQPPSGEQEFPGYAVSIAPFKGGWYEAARIYRPWALQQKWAARGPDQRRGSYVAELACWLWNRGRIDIVLPPTKEVARRLGLPVAVDWYWWHKNPYDADYPDYFPPREGHDRFCAAVKDLQEHGVAVQVYTNGMSWDRAEPGWETEGKAGTIIERDGEPFGIIFNTWMDRRLMQMCGASPVWHHRVLQTADKAAALGLDGLYLDMIAVHGGLRPCFSTEHGHVPGGGAYGLQGYRELLRKVREQHPELMLSSESFQEMYLDLLDCGISLFTSGERVIGEEWTRTTRVVPLHAAVYHGHGVAFGNYAHIDGITPYDELWPPESRTDPSKERDWQAICPDQFAMELARTVAFGCQPLMTNLTKEHLENPKFEADVAFFLDICRFYHAHREWLLWGELLEPGHVKCETVDVTCIARLIFTRPETIEPFTVRQPTVFHGGWRAPDGRAGLALINYTRREQAVTVERVGGLALAGNGEMVLPARSMCFVPLEPV